jgi:hypothetical protein
MLGYIERRDVSLKRNFLRSYRLFAMRRSVSEMKHHIYELSG